MSFLLLFLATVYLLPDTVDGNTLWRNAGCKNQSHSPCVCSGTSNRYAQVPTSVGDLAALYQNCTRVMGSVELSHINATEDMNFFDDIQEIKGYIFIYKVQNIRRISFKNLRIIWGDNTLDGCAIYITNTTMLEEISMPNLRSVHNGKICVKKTPRLCHLGKSTVNFGELLDLDESRVDVDTPPRCSKKKVECHPSCNGYCWGPREEDCQSIYRSHCPDLCDSKMCYTDNSTNSLKCCNSQCVAGCYGPTAKDCHACRAKVQEGKCVDQCTKLMKYDAKLGKVVPDENGHYTYDRYCEKECPAERLIQDDICVEHCAEGFHHDASLSNRICEKCEGKCPKVCRLEEELDYDVLQQLVNCTEIDGPLIISVYTFTGGISRNNISHVIPPIVPEDLNVLKSVRIVTHYLYATVLEHPLTTFEFLENLEVIEGRRLKNQKQSLIISTNDNLFQLGLRKLRMVKAGDIVITNNHELCLAESIQWKTITSKNSNVNIQENRGVDKCGNENKTCDRHCDLDDGCWGIESHMCRKCLTWKMDEKCVDECPSEGYFANETIHECQKCHPTCLTCTGTEENKCTSCRNYVLYLHRHKEETSTTALDVHQPTTIHAVHHRHRRHPTNLSCFDQCPDQYYPEDGECKPCDPSCYSFGCTGPSSHQGDGGCNTCKFAVVRRDESIQIERCLYQAEDLDEKEICKNNNLSQHFQSAINVKGVDSYVCEPCDPECLSCTSLGTSRNKNNCECRSYEVETRFGLRCMDECPKGTRKITKEERNSSIGFCEMCHSSCERIGQGVACTGPDNTQCTACANVTFVNENGQQECLSQCPNGTFLYLKDRHCYDVDYDSHYRNIKVVVSIICALTFVVIVIGSVCLVRSWMHYKKELEKEQVLHAPDIPEIIPLGALERPIMERLNLITKQNLQRFSKQLGSGAFGVVYAGVWIPPGKNLKVPVAIKVVRDPSGKAQAEMLEEATKMAMMRHDHLLRIVGVCLSGDDIQLITLLRPLGNLQSFMQKHRAHLGGAHLLLYCYQIASGMKYLAEHRLVHRDLAARNVLVKNYQHVEITDFGLAKMINYGAESVEVGEGKVALKWLAIEALEKQIYNTATDVWAFGVTCWEILTYGQSPYQGKDMTTIKEYLDSGNRLAQPNNCSSQLYQTLLQCWLENPESRPTFSVLKDNFNTFCRAPHLFVPDLQQLETLNDHRSQRELIQEIIDDTDFEDPQNYFDDEPRTPDSVVPAPRVGRRLDSTTSNRYQADPTQDRQQFGMDDGNYLVPNSKDAGPPVIMYTPIVVNEAGQTELVEAHEYYNEVGKNSEYVNDTKRRRNRPTIEEEDEDEDEEVDEKESCL